MPTTGLAFSGGGIRSAALCSGVLRRLLQRGVEPDHLSCVSGGGYTGTAYVDWKYRNKEKDDPSWHKRFFAHMRSRAGLLCDWQRPLYGILDTMIILALMLFVSVITPLVMWSSYACPLAFVIEFLFGDILRAGRFRCADQQNSTETSDSSCVIERGTQAFSRLTLFAVSLVLYFVFYIWTKVTSKFSGMAHLLSALSGLLFAFTFGPWFIHDFLDHTAFVFRIAIVVVSILMWIVSPALRSKASLILVVYANAYVIYWRVYDASIFGIKHTGQLFLVLLFISGLVMCFVPAFSAFQMRLVNIYVR